MTYAETIDYLYTTLPMFSRMGSAALKHDLTNTIALCEALGNPQNSFKTVHVAGTNGKGSVSHSLAAIFQNAGYKTGLYTSPHLYDFRERIRLNGEFIAQDFVVNFVESIKPLIEKIEPSFFEITVAMAFAYFAQEKVDVAVIEVGLGGRLDSTNVITPELSVITNIGWDHMNVLGHSLEQISREKAGIIKPGVPVVIGETLPETKPVFLETASQKNAAIFLAEECYAVLEQKLFPDKLQLVFRDSEGNPIAVETDLPGLYQVKNLRTVMCAVGVLRSRGWKLSDSAVRSALANVKKLTGLAGRWEVISHSPTTVLEVAHNKEGIEQLLNHLSHLSYEHLHIVFGMVRDKEAGSILSLLPSTAVYYFSAAHIPRALRAEELKSEATKFKLAGEAYEDVNLALQTARSRANKNDLIVVCGSIFLVAEVDRF